MLQRRRLSLWTVVVQGIVFFSIMSLLCFVPKVCQRPSSSSSRLVKTLSSIMSLVNTLLILVFVLMVDVVDSCR